MFTVPSVETSNASSFKLGALAMLRKAAISCAMSVHPSVSVELLFSTGRILAKFSIWGLLLKFVEKIKFWVNSDRKSVSLHEDLHSCYIVDGDLCNPAMQWELIVIFVLPCNAFNIRRLCLPEYQGTNCVHCDTDCSFTLLLYGVVILRTSQQD